MIAGLPIRPQIGGSCRARVKMQRIGLSEDIRRCTQEGIEFLRVVYGHNLNVCPLHVTQIQKHCPRCRDDTSCDGLLG